MTQDEKTLFEVQISKVNNSAGSIFSKDDVLSLLTTLQSCIADLPQAQPEQFTKQYILDTVEEALNEFDYDEFTTFDPELQGAYGSSWSLEINHSFNDREFKRGLLTVLEDYLTLTK